MSEHRRGYRRVTKALRLAQSGEADSIVAAAKEILSTRIKHGDALSSPTAVRDYLRLLLHDREYEVFAAVFLNAQHRVLVYPRLKASPSPVRLELHFQPLKWLTN